MANAADREGNFRAVITSYGLKEMESGAVAVSIKASLTDFWDGTEWFPWKEYDVEAEGDVWIVKKNGDVNLGQAEALCRYAGWDGDMESIVQETWQPRPVTVAIQKDEYKRHVRYKIAFINDYNRTPGAMSNVDREKAKALQAKHGAAFRAIAGNVQRNTAPPPPSGKFPTPPPPVKAPANVDASADIPW